MVAEAKPRRESRDRLKNCLEVAAAAVFTDTTVLSFIVSGQLGAVR